MKLRRRGVMLFELGVAAVVIGGLMSLVAYVLVQGASWRRESQARVLAAEQASNLLDRCVSLQRAELTQEKLDELARGIQDEQLLNDESVTAKLRDDADGKRIAVEIRWKSPLGDDQRPMRLATWVYDTKEANSP